eukprot:3650852-Alexandrium_andersonii.AAC.1
MCLQLARPGHTDCVLMAALAQGVPSAAKTTVPAQATQGHRAELLHPECAARPCAAPSAAMVRTQVQGPMLLVAGPVLMG